MRSRRLFVEQLESRVVLSGLGPALGPPEADWVSVIVSLHDQTGPPQTVAQGVLNRFGGRMGHVYQHALNGFSAQLPPAAVAALQKNPLVKTVEPDMVLHTMAQTVPTGVERIGTLDSSIAGIGTGEMINVGIAIIDTGIQSDHPDLRVEGGIHYGYRNSGPPSSRFFVSNNYNDDNGHGTHVAGIAAALDNDFGVVGVAPGARLYAVKVLDANGAGQVSNIIKGIDWVTANANVIQVANMSLGGVGYHAAYHQAIQASVKAGIVYVVAAGNNGIDIHGSDKTFGTSDDFIPAAYAEVATISAFVDTDGDAGGDGSSWYWSGGNRWLEDDTFADFSNFSNSDEAKNQAWLEQNIAILEQERHGLGLGIDLVMPGVNIYSTYLNDGYATASGTSMAAPHAAGLAALHIAANPRPTGAGAEWVYGVRRALIDMGEPWRSPLGLVHPGIGANPDSPDKYEENVGWAGPKVVELGPAVSIETPTDGALLQDVGDVFVKATASGDRAISQVQFSVGEWSVTGTESNGSWSATWPTKDGETFLHPDGTYTITAVAKDSEGKTGSHSIQVHLDNVDDPPTVAITSPTGGIVSGMVVITAEATDDRGLQQVEFLVNGASIGADVDGTDGWSVEWNTTPVNDGPHTITAVARDTGGNSAISGDVSVTVKNDVATMTASLEGRAIPVNRNFWQAEVTVAVVDVQLDGGLVGATVTGRWNTNSTVTGTTGSNGTVTFNSGNLRTNVSSITFELTGVELAPYEYVAGDTSIITVNSPGSTTVQAARLEAPVLWRASSADNSTGGGASALPNGLAGTTVPAVLEASPAADDDAHRVADSDAESTVPRRSPPARSAAVATGGGRDDSPIADSDEWPLYTSAVDELLATEW